MQGPEFRPIQSDIAGSNVHDTVDRKNNEQQQKIADLKARIQSGQYRADLSTLAKQIRESGALGDE